MNTTGIATLRALRTTVTRRHRKLKRTTRPPRLETLESRQMLAADFALQLGAPLEGSAGDADLPAEQSSVALPPSTFQEAGLMIDHGNAPNGLPLLSSNPSAAAKIYLDFDGHFEPQWGSYSNVTTPPWSLDSDPTTFNSTEAAGIRAIWQRVAEDFAPFNLDVTTIEPDSFANRQGLRVSIGGNGSWFGNATGLAYRNTWTNSIVNTVYVFPGRLSNNIKYIAEVASHEVGHAFGLHHQSTYNSSGTLVNEYNPGSGNWAPIMGNGLTRTRTTWHVGPSTSATTIQDDLAVITSPFNAFGYRQDDHGGLDNPTPLTLDDNGNAQVVGVIERNDDVDAFSFEVLAHSTGDFRVDVFDVGPNLLAKLQLWSDDGQLLVTANPNATFGASFTYELDPGHYTLAVQNNGVYGALGHYTVHVDLEAIPVYFPLSASDDHMEVEGDSDFVVIDVLANDSTNVNVGYPVTIIGVTSPTQGGVVEIIDGTAIRYRPAPGFVGQESFVYTIHDGTPVDPVSATVSVEVTPPPVTEPDTPILGNIVNFLDYTIDSYGGSSQDLVGPVEVIDNGATLHMVGNRWKKIDFAYDITPDTILEFDFWSTAQGEIHGIGFDNTLAVNSSRTFKVYGTQNWGRANFNNYALSAPEVARYVIPVGEFYTGSFQYLFFTNDHDVKNPTAESFFSNIQVYEKGNPPLDLPDSENPVVANDDQFLVEHQPGGTLLDVLANDLAKDQANEHLRITSVSTTEVGASVEVLEGLSIRYIPPAGFGGTDTFTYSIIDTRNGEEAHATVTVEVKAMMANGYINLLDYSIDSYGGASQDLIGPVHVIDGGATLHMVGNRWKKIDFAYNVTPDTILEFDFWSTAQGEIHGIGFDNTLAVNSSRTFKVYGTQNWGRANFNNYAQHAPEVVRYSIPVGDFYTGSFQYLFFTNDHDVSNPTAESYFSNIRVYEKGELPLEMPDINTPVVANDDQFLVEHQPGGTLLDVLANDFVHDGGHEHLRITSVSTTDSGASVEVVDGLSIRYVPMAGFRGADSFTYSIVDTRDGTEASGAVTVEVKAIMADGYINLLDYSIDSYGGASQDLIGPVHVIDGGATLHMVGNRWKKIDFAYDVTPDTILEFDFWSTAQGEIHGIGFDNTLAVNSSRTFKVYGTQNWGRANFNNYAQHAPEVVRYSIPVGDFYTGSFQYLFFTNDHDVSNPTAESYFSNIRVYEQDNGPLLGATPLGAFEEPTKAVCIPALEPDLTGQSVAAIKSSQHLPVPAKIGAPSSRFASAHDLYFHQLGSLDGSWLDI